MHFDSQGSSAASSGSEGLRELSELLGRAKRVAFLSSELFTPSAAKLRDALAARNCDVIAGLEGELLDRGTARGIDATGSMAPTKRKKSDLLQATAPVDVVLLLGSAPASAKAFNPKSRPGPLQIAAAAVFAAASEKVPLFTIADAQENSGCNILQGGPEMVEKLTALVQAMVKLEPTASESHWDEASLAARCNDSEKLLECLARWPELRASRDSEGRTLLHLAAAAGARSAVASLLDSGVVWHAQDKQEVTAGEEALLAGHQDIFDQLVKQACTSERKERITRGEEPAAKRHCSPHSLPYLKQRLRYEDGKLLDAFGNGVMMGWEAPLMERHAELLQPAGADVLNVGFGLGLVDGYLQRHCPRSHAIVEAHADVLQEVRRQGWYERAGVTVHEGQWQDVVSRLPAASFDAIFYDTYEETYLDLRKFLAHVPRLLRPGGRLSFFNGMAPYDIFYHAVYCRMAQEDLLDIGLACDYCAMEIGDLGDSTWQGVVQRYWSFRTYYLPLATMSAEQCSSDTSEGVCAKDVASASDGTSWRRWPSNAVRVGDAVGDGVEVSSEYWSSPPPSEDEGGKVSADENSKELDAIFDSILEGESSIEKGPKESAEDKAARAHLPDSAPPERVRIELQKVLAETDLNSTTVGALRSQLEVGLGIPEDTLGSDELWPWIAGVIQVEIQKYVKMLKKKQKADKKAAEAAEENAEG